ncbi:MAG: DUF5678 domain-containing protein [Candidatus Bathyarchaeia archaeon]
MTPLSDILALFREQELNRKWFEEDRERLVKEYDGKFITIYKQAVVDSDEDVRRLMERVERKYPSERISVEYVSREKLQPIL